jgi:sec-independent protein translocase protein TatA
MIGDLVQPTHLLLILIVALLVLGPKRLPEVGRSLGKGLRDFKDAVSSYSPDRLLDGDDEPAAHAPEAAASELRREPPAVAATAPAAPAQPPPALPAQSVSAASVQTAPGDAGEAPTAVSDAPSATHTQSEPVDAEVVPDEHAERTTR